MKAKFQNTDALELLARCSAIYGPQGRDDAQVNMLADEMVLAFGDFPTDEVREAASAVFLKVSKYWPTIAEIRDEIVQRRKAVGLGSPGRPVWEDDSPQTPRDAASVARVEQMVANFLRRQKADFDPPRGVPQAPPEDDEAMVQSPEVSDLSDELYHRMTKRRDEGI